MELRKGPEARRVPVEVVGPVGCTMVLCVGVARKGQGSHEEKKF
jgi:hypothetical protein